jgi:MFS family permease
MPTGARRSLMLTVILIGYLLVLIDVSIVMVALPHIRDSLGFSATALSWVQNASTLAFGGMLLLGARVGDLLGRRRTFIAGIGLFTAASLAVGLAQSPAWLIAARAVQGIGAATLAPSTLALLSTSFPAGTDRARAMAAYGSLGGIGVTIGLLLGGIFTDWLSWRVGFFINVPVGIAAMLAAPRLLPETPRHEGHLDIAGALSSTFGASLLVYGIVRSAAAGWGDTLTLAALATEAALIAFFVVEQARSAQPIMPLRLAPRHAAGRRRRRRRHGDHHGLAQPLVRRHRLPRRRRAADGLLRHRPGLQSELADDRGDGGRRHPGRERRRRPRQRLPPPRRRARPRHPHHRLRIRRRR